MKRKSDAAGRHVCARFGALAAISAALTMAVFLGLSSRGDAQSSTAVEPKIFAQLKTSEPMTLVIFADRKMGDGEWTALFDALRREAVEAAAEKPEISAYPILLRGDAVKPGLRVESAIVVHLHGDCSLTSPPGKPALGEPLGWAMKAHGRIEPFAHVDCTTIEQVLGPRAAALRLAPRNAMMAGAVARVILHEWIHIATQNPGHSRHGISKAEFSNADLTAGDSEPVAKLGNSR